MSQTTEQGKACAVLSYLLIGIVWFFAEEKMRRNTFAKFHVKQAIIFMILLIIVNLAVALFSIISPAFAEILGYIVYALLAIIWLLAIIYVAAGKEKKIPVFGVFAKALDF
ncbi:MAG: hypothetical protein ACP5N2_05995 [Candidatus Nanoarchaeia archaeon]